jgi:cytoskeletal protein CcmA (bactofilin family)
MLGNKRRNGNGGAEAAGAGVTLIAQGARIVGDVFFTGQLDVEGHIEGNVIAESEDTALVRIIASGSVKGQIVAPDVVINGVVTGDISCSRHIELAERARVTGNVRYQVLEMARGAEVNGGLQHVAAVAVLEHPASKAQLPASRMHTPLLENQ